MKHILVIPSWFPDRNQPFPGDFILRYTESISLYNRVTVFYTSFDKNIRKPEFIKKVINPNLTIHTYYYPPSAGVLGSLRNGAIRYFALRKLYTKIFTSSAPDLVHVHVAYQAGLYALFLKKMKGIPYIVSEQDCIYMPGYDNFHVPGLFEKKIAPFIFRNAVKVHAVSKSLAMALKKMKFSAELPEVIPNVVNTGLFHYSSRLEHKKFCFIHVSTLTNQKNPEGMLAALALVKKIRTDFVLSIIGQVNEKIKELIYKLGLEEHVVLLGELPQEDVARHISQSDAMIHFTRYETFGCVLAESICCGVPVIVSDLEVTRELIVDGVNGLLVKENDIGDLAAGIILFMENGIQFDRQRIAGEGIKKFNYELIGKTFDELYGRILSG